MQGVTGPNPVVSTKMRVCLRQTRFFYPIRRERPLSILVFSISRFSALCKGNSHFEVPILKSYQKTLLGSVLCVLAAMIWGFAFSAQRAAGDGGMPPLTLTSLRSFVATAALFFALMLLSFRRGVARPILSRREGRLFLDISRGEWIGGALCGVALALASALQQIGLSLNESAGKTAFLTAMYVTLVPVFGLFVGRKTRPLVFLATLFALLGAFLLAGDFSNGFSLGLGDLFVLLCAVVYAVHILVIDRFSPGCDGVRLSLVQFLVAGVLTLPALLFEDISAITGDAVLALLYLGIMSSGVGYTLQILAQKQVHPAIASAILSLESVFGVLGGALVFSEALSLREGIGCAILFLAVMLAELGGLLGGESKNKKAASELSAAYPRERNEL